MKQEDYFRLVEICRRYYEKEQTQAEIAKAFSISRPAVSKLLSEARQLGIVRIEIRSIYENDDYLLDELKRVFGLKGGLIVPTGAAEEGLNRQMIVSQAADYLAKLLPDIEKWGVGWGETVRDVINELEIQDQVAGKEQCVCPVIGSAPTAMQWMQTNELARILAEKLKSKPYYLHAPAFPVSESDKNLFMGTDEYRQVSEIWSGLDAVLLGIGSYPTVPDQATAARFGNILHERKAVGVLASYYYDTNGNFIDSPTDFAVRIPLDCLRSAKRVIVVSGRNKKVRALLGGLKSGLISHLITDDTTARELIRLI
ncbi:sugar-binding transcriptional regulator [Cohaesibacter celericrescens]|uniref:DNA-binding transcriptional regulator n=1 Tax=Cohaesibacter celericrescens TaxID=2067669 RepID=A0A2N5XRL1_9HYPH|nr:sugar-binding domain-containing protein [Cohaesibacter celericrescens]PLW77153.1 DNA-binding transcriptional regulator [Cohaesibacter celericrescens]